MDKKKIITLDLTDCKYLGELHQRIKTAFDFPDWYGENWDAFWDLLWDCDTDKVEILGENTLSKEFNWHIKTMHEILQRNKDNREKYGWSFDFEIIN